MFGRKPPSDCTAVIAAAGSGERFGGDKLFAAAHGKPVLAHTLEAFEKAACIHKIIIVTRTERISDVSGICKTFGISKVSQILAGGETRAESVLRGVMAAGKSSFVAIHDGARPLVSDALICRVAERAAKTLAAVPALPLCDTVKVVKDGLVLSTPDRSTLHRIQTPQVFETNLVKGALYDAIQKGHTVTDDSAAVEALGIRVAVVAGEERNIKITTAEDFTLFEVMLCENRTGI